MCIIESWNFLPWSFAIKFWGLVNLRLVPDQNNPRGSAERVIPLSRMLSKFTPWRIQEGMCTQASAMEMSWSRWPCITYLIKCVLWVVYHVMSVSICSCCHRETSRDELRPEAIDQSEASRSSYKGLSGCGVTSAWWVQGLVGKELSGLARQLLSKRYPTVCSAASATWIRHGAIKPDTLTESGFQIRGGGGGGGGGWRDIQLVTAGLVHHSC